MPHKLGTGDIALALVHQRIFQGKAGKNADLVSLIQEGIKIIGEHGTKLKSRILTNCTKDPTDLVIWEIEVKDLSALDYAFDRAMSNPQGQELMESWYLKLTELVVYTEVKNWTIH